jgi:adenylate cyclase
MTSIAQYVNNLYDANGQMFSALIQVSNQASSWLNRASDYLSSALENTSQDDFQQYLNYRNQAYDFLRQCLTNEALGMSMADYVNQTRDSYLQYYPEDTNPDEAAFIKNEADYALTVIENISHYLGLYDTVDAQLKELLPGKTAIIGRVDTGSTDFGVNPFSAEYLNTGTHGAVTDTVLTESFIYPVPAWVSALLALILCPLLNFAFSRFKLQVRITLEVLSIVLVFGLATGLFAGFLVYIGPLCPCLALFASLISTESISFAFSEKDKQFIRSTFSTYLSDAVVKDILQKGETPQLGGEERWMSAIFTDIRGFSTVTEKLNVSLGPQEGAKALVLLLNRYLSQMSNQVLDFQGVIDKYEGDAIIAFFGAPMTMSDHAYRACAAAVKMKQIEEGLNKTFLEEGIAPNELLTRIGINTGNMVVGNMGTQKKMDYTIMGNAVNIAARLEGVNKQYGTWILTTETTIKETGDKLIYRHLDRVRVVGIKEPIRLCNVLGIAGEEGAPELERKRDMCMAALQLFEARDWAKSMAAFQELESAFPGDGPPPIYIKRCQAYMQDDPASDWDGVYNLDQK